MSVKNEEESAVASVRKKLRELQYTNPDTVVDHAINLMKSYNSFELASAVIERRGNRDELIKLHGKVTITPPTDKFPITGALTVWVEKNFPSQAPIVTFTQTNFPSIYFEPFLNTKHSTVLYSPFYEWVDLQSSLLDMIDSISIHFRQVCLGWLLSARDQEDPNFSIPPRLSLPTGFQPHPLPVPNAPGNTLEATPIGARPPYLNVNQIPPNSIQNPQIPVNSIPSPQLGPNLIQNPQLGPNLIQNPQLAPNLIPSSQIMQGHRPMMPPNTSHPINDLRFSHAIPPFPHSMYPVVRQTSSQELAPSYLSLIGPVLQQNYSQSIPNRPPPYPILSQPLSPPKQQQQQQLIRSPTTPKIINASPPIQQQQQQQQQQPNSQNGIITSPILSNKDSSIAPSPRDVPASARQVIPKP